MTATSLTTTSVAKALQPGGDVAAAYDAVWQKLWDQPYVPAAVLELCRLRLAQLHRVDAELATRQSAAADEGLTEDKIQSLLSGAHLHDPRFSSAELAALEFTEIYAQDPGAIGDEQADAVKAALGEPGLVCLVESLGFIEGRIRLALMFSALTRQTH